MERTWAVGAVGASDTRSCRRGSERRLRRRRIRMVLAIEGDLPGYALSCFLLPRLRLPDPR